MFHLLSQFRMRATRRALTRATFCEECGEVCTPACRHEALREQARYRVQRAGFYRF